MNKKKAVVLLSGGLDSSTTLYHALAKGYQAHCLIFDYGQRHRKEITRAKKIARAAGVPSVCVSLSLPWRGSALLDRRIPVPVKGKDPLPLSARRQFPPTAQDIPVTYVPGRNIIFLSFAASFAEAIGAKNIFIGANAVDYSGYPDCRPQFIRAYQTMLMRGLKTSVEGKPIKVSTPLIFLTKAQIVTLAVKLKVPLQWTWSCYKGQKSPCGQCDSCRLRALGFRESKVKDPGI